MKPPPCCSSLQDGGGFLCLCFFGWCGSALGSAFGVDALTEVEVLDSALTCAPPEHADRVSIIAAESAAIELHVVRLNIIVSSFLVCGCVNRRIIHTTTYGIQWNVIG